MIVVMIVLMIVLCSELTALTGQLWSHRSRLLSGTRARSGTCTHGRTHIAVLSWIDIVECDEVVCCVEVS